MAGPQRFGSTNPHAGHQSPHKHRLQLLARISPLTGGDFGAAISQLREQLANRPTDANIYFRLRHLFEHVGDTASAEQLGDTLESKHDIPARAVLSWRLTHATELLSDLPDIRRQLLNEILTL